MPATSKGPPRRVAPAPGLREDKRWARPPPVLSDRQNGQPPAGDCPATEPNRRPENKSVRLGPPESQHYSEPKAVWPEPRSFQCCPKCNPLSKRPRLL